MGEPIAVFAATPAYCEQARALAERVAGVLVEPGDIPAEALALRIDDSGLCLMADGMELSADFSTMLPRLQQGALSRELLVRAARVRGVDRPRAIDATAGLGEDSIMLAAAGFEVAMFERDPVIAALLDDALRRAAEDARLSEIVGRMRLVEGDSVAALRALDYEPDVVYLDPMFPGRTKSAAVKKKFQLLHHLEQPCDDEEELLAAAFAARPRKVVVKRPPKGPWLAGRKPSHSIEGKAVRYDCYVLPR